MSKKQSQPKFNTGDRVAEKPKPHGIFTTSPEAFQRIQSYRAQRYGTVLETVYQRGSNKASVPYLKIIWDGTQSPSTHAQSRICLEKDLATITNDYFNARD
jgi:hypothetical protein